MAIHEPWTRTYCTLIHLSLHALTLRSLEKVLGWSIHIMSVRGEQGFEMRSLVTKANSKTYVSFIAVNEAGMTISAEKVHE